MRRIMPALAAAVVIASLAGCSPGAEDHSDEAYRDGACIDRMNGADSDRTALVDCDEPHLYEVTAIRAWPELTDWIARADGDFGAVWDAINLDDASPEALAYRTWASRACNEAAQYIIGIDQVEVEGHTAADLQLRVGGTYNVDDSLATRDELVRGGDGSTACALAWYDEVGAPRLVTGPLFAELVNPGFGLDRRECWDVDGRVGSCEQPHAAQVILEFDGLEAFGPELIARAATGAGNDADRVVVEGFCEGLLSQTMPSTLDFGDLGSRSDKAASLAWNAFDGTVDPEGGYVFACLAVGPQAGDLITGDVFDGTALLAR